MADRYEKKTRKAQLDALELGNLGSLLGVSQMSKMNPLDVQMRQQQVQGAGLQNRQTSGLMPHLFEQARLQNTGMRDDIAWNDQLRPAQLGMLQGQTRGVQLENDLAKALMQPRIQGAQAGAQMDQSRARVQQGTEQSQIGAANYAPQAAAQAVRGAELQNNNQFQQNQMQKQLFDQNQQMHPWEKLFRQGQALQAMQGGLMGATTGKMMTVKGKDGKEMQQPEPLQLDTMKLMQGLDSGIPFQQGAAPQNDLIQTLQLLQQSGMMTPEAIAQTMQALQQQQEGAKGQAQLGGILSKLHPSFKALTAF